ncbi:MAG: hypothetical protein K2K73_00455, partial [Ureaplasma sp.]|nr:hypothetical protein [Ureaplasma sp.]
TESIRNTRIEFINELCDKFLIIDENQIIKNNKKELRDNKFDKLLLNKFFGIFMLIIVVLAVYYVTFGSYAGGWINEQWTGLLEKGQEAAFEAINASNVANSFWLGKFVGEGLLGGIFTVIGFLPYIMIMYFLITILEHSGFLARMSVLLDKTLDKFGLSGRSIITLFTGVGCNIPAIMMARNSQSKKERVILILIGPLIACSARLVVYEWIVQRMIGDNNFVWLITLSLTIFSGLVAVLVGYFFSNTLFRKQNNFFMTELPRWRAPHILVILKGMGVEVWNFIKRVLTIIFIVNLIIFFLLYISPKTGLINSEDAIEQSLLYYIAIPFKYLFYPIGLGEDWRLSVSLLAAAPAKELAASNLEILFSGENGFHEFLFGANSIIKAPIATSISYLLFFTFYIPCVATIVVMKKEAGWKWTGIHLLAAFILSYCLSLFSYSFGGMIEKMIQHPEIISNVGSIIAIIFTIINFALVITFIINQLIFNYKLKLSERFIKYKSIFWKVAIAFVLATNIAIVWMV